MSITHLIRGSIGAAMRRLARFFISWVDRVISTASPHVSSPNRPYLLIVIRYIHGVVGR